LRPKASREEAKLPEEAGRNIQRGLSSKEKIFIPKKEPFCGSDNPIGFREQYSASPHCASDWGL
jgi:hypothetical protein